jgi:glycerol-1-phosphate dehydrogenase [NAD(P)+]
LNREITLLKSGFQMTDIEEALRSARETRVLITGGNILGRVPKVFEELFPGKRAVIVADSNTFEIAGRQIVEALASAEVEQLPPFIFEVEGLYAEYGMVEKLRKSLMEHDAIPVAVGSGTINDLTKLASHESSRSYICVATAASMDGYTAFGASVTADGKKQTFSCPAPAACIADIDIISRAPAAMTASGYADLFAKITAGADWILADVLGREPLDSTSWEIVQGGLKESLSNPEWVRNGNPEAITKLINGLMLSGFAMQSHRSSRPASGAEHQFSHLWNMEHHTNHGESISHGFQVAIGTLAVTALYEQMLNTPLEELDVERCVAAWPTREELELRAVEMFRDTDFPDIGREEALPKYITPEDLRTQLMLLKSVLPQLKSRLAAQLVPFDEVRRCFEMAGAPVSPEQIGMSREYLRESFVRAQFIRRRFTILDLAVRTGMLDKWLDGVFGKDGVFSSSNL